MVVAEPRDTSWMPGCAFLSLVLTNIIFQSWFYFNKDENLVVLDMAGRLLRPVLAVALENNLCINLRNKVL
jgi:hypothetical protein